jgi:hypothetical protein
MNSDSSMSCCTAYLFFVCLYENALRVLDKDQRQDVRKENDCFHTVKIPLAYGPPCLPRR